MDASAKVKKLLRDLAFPARILSIDLSKLELNGKDMPSHELMSLIGLMRKSVDRLEELIKSTRLEVK